MGFRYCESEQRIQGRAGFPSTSNWFAVAETQEIAFWF